MDPQYATVNQLTEITDTMASLRDAILGLGQRIDRHRPNHYWFQEAPYLTLLHLHLHHHHLGLLYNKTIQFHLRHHPQFNQSHGLGHLSYMVRLTLRHILL